MMAKKENSLPNGWKLTTLGNIAKWGSGGTPKSTEKKYYGGTIPWLIIGDLNDSYVYQSRTHITNEGLKNSSAKIIQPNSVLLAMYGSIGKLGINKIPLATNQAIAFTEKLNDDVYYLYLFYYLLSIRSKLHSLGKGGTQKNISQTVLKPVTIPLPPFEIQQQIVKKIETLFSELDNSVANLKAAKAQLKRYRQSVLKSAFEGKLTAAWREANGDKLETAETLMERIKAEREAAYETKLIEWKEAVNSWEKDGKEGKKPSKPKKLKEFQTLSINDLFSLPKEWNWVYWNDILENDEGSFKRGPFGSSLTKSMFVSSGYKVYEQYCPINDDPSFARYYITDQKYNELKSFAVKAKDFLISCSGVTLGRITQIPDLFEEGIINQALLRVRHNHNIYSDDFFVYLFRSRYFQKMIFDNSTGSAIPNVKGVNELKSIPLPLMSIEEQHQIVNEIESRLSEADVMERTIDESLIKAEKMRQSILKKAFEGRLVG